MSEESGDGLNLMGKLTREGGQPDHLFSSGFAHCPRAQMYQAWVYPELFPDEPQPVLRNWSDEELEMYCGIYNRKDIP